MTKWFGRRTEKEEAQSKVKGSVCNWIILLFLFKALLVSAPENGFQFHLSLNYFHTFFVTAKDAKISARVSIDRKSIDLNPVVVASNVPGNFGRIAGVTGLKEFCELLYEAK